MSLIDDLVFDLAFVAAALLLRSCASARRRPTSAFAAIPLGKRGARHGARCASPTTSSPTIYASLFQLHGERQAAERARRHQQHRRRWSRAAVFVCVIAPIAEEFFFRGFFFGALRQLEDRHRRPATSAPGWRRSSRASCSACAHPGSAPSQYLIPLGLPRASCCASCAGRPARCIRAWRCIAPTTRSRSGDQPAALERAEVVLTSGAHASYYVDAKRAILLPEGFGALGELVAAQAAAWGATAVGGMTMGADPIACAALAGGADVKAFFVRKEVKAHGLARRIEGPSLEPGDRCAVVEDVVTTGGSTLARSGAPRRGPRGVRRASC